MSKKITKSMKNQKQKRRISLILVMTMLLTMLPATEAHAATTLNASDIVNRLNGLAGTTNSSRAGRCLTWVFDQYKALGATDAKIGKSCSCAYEAGTVLVQSTSRSNIPTGSLVFFKGKSSQGKCSCGNYYGHVGIYVGDDYIVSIRSSGKILKEKISDWVSWGYAYRGWGMPKNVIINQNTAADTTPPTISNVQVTEQDANGYTVTAQVTDDSGVSRVQFPTWTEYNGQDDIASEWGTNSSVSGIRNGNIFTFRVNVSDHNNEGGTYHTHIYAYDNYGNSNCVAVSTYVDRTGPAITDAQVTDISRDGYTVSCKATDISGINRVQFPTWTAANWQDDLAQNWYDGPSVRGNCDGNTFTFRVNKSEHGNELSDYITHIYAFDNLGNYTHTEVKVSSLLGDMQNIGTDFLATIQNKSSQTVLTKDDDDNVTGRSYIGSENQLWLFSRMENGTYKIASAADQTQCLDVYGGGNTDGTNVHIYSDNGTIAQRWKIYQDEGGYVFIPCCSDSRSLEINGGSAAEGENVQIYQYWAGTPDIFDIEMKNPIVNISNDSLNLKEGETATLTAAVYPDVFETGVKWLSSDPSVATVENGVVKAVRAGNVIITASSVTNDTLTAQCSVTVEVNPTPENSEGQSDGENLTEEFQSQEKVQNNISMTDDEMVSESDLEGQTTIKDKKEIGDAVQQSQNPEGKTESVKEQPQSITEQIVSDTMQSQIIQGSTYMVGNAKYKVTSASKKTVAYIKPVKKIAKAEIPDTVTINGVSCQVTAVADKAFYKNKKIKNVTIGTNVTAIGKSAFMGCSKLRVVNIRTEKLKKIGKKAFRRVPSKCTIYVPAGKYDKYNKMYKKAR